MELLIRVMIIYFVIGLYKAINHIGSGRVGTKGPLITFITVTLLWPVI